MKTVTSITLLEENSLEEKNVLQWLHLLWVGAPRRGRMLSGVVAADNGRLVVLLRAEVDRISSCCSRDGAHVLMVPLQMLAHICGAG